MLQLHDEKDWHIRNTAGQNVMGWTSKFVADKAPAEWTVVTVYLFADFGERTLRGITLTAGVSTRIVGETQCQLPKRGRLLVHQTELRQFVSA
jgi:hypothetical protein